MGVPLTTILELPERLAGLTGGARERASRLADARLVTATTEPPAELHGWLAETFGSVDVVRRQTIVKVVNPTTLDATIFAPLRGRRPLDGTAASHGVGHEIASTVGDPFCHPETGTPADSFGRVQGRRMVTGANAGMAEAHHAVLVFDTHDPLAFDDELVADILATGRAWAEKAREGDPSAVNYTLIWNCLWRAGGSIIHGHAQALLGSGPHIERLERLRRDARLYGERHGDDLVEDLVAVHRSVGLTVEMDDGVTLVASLTPRKERELLLVGTAGMDETDPRFTQALARLAIAYRDRIGVRSFNLALWRPPLGPVADWDGIPPMAHLVDRGDPLARSSDIGAMELYGTPIVGSDPFALIEALR